MALSWSRCWTGQWQFYRCCVASDPACQWGVEGVGPVFPDDLTLERCCFEEPPLSKDYQPLASAFALGRASGALRCDRRWLAVRRALLLQHPVVRAFDLAARAYHGGPCLLAEVCLTLIRLIVRVQVANEPIFVSNGPLQLLERFVNAALPLLLDVAASSDGASAAIAGWPFFSYLDLFRQYVVGSGNNAATKTNFCDPLDEVGQAWLTAARVAATAAIEVAAFARAAEAAAETFDASAIPTLTRNGHVLAFVLRAATCPDATASVGRRPSRHGCTRIRAATAALTVALGRGGGTDGERSQMLQHRQRRRLARGALALIATDVRAARNIGFRRIVLTPWPVVDLLGSFADSEPVVLGATDLLVYYRLWGSGVGMGNSGVGAGVNSGARWESRGSRALLPSQQVSNVTRQRRSFRMRLLRDDSISLAIRAHGLPFCGSPLYLRWVRNLWRRGYKGRLNIVEGGAEAGSCLLWAAAMLDGDLVNFGATAAEPMPAAASAFAAAARLNGWESRIQVIQAALVNETDTARVSLQVPLGRVGEASNVLCAAGSGGCEGFEAPAVRLDALPADMLPMPGIDVGGSGISSKTSASGDDLLVIHALKLNIMGFELEALRGAAGWLFDGVGLSGRVLVCSVLLDELRFDRSHTRGGAEDVRRLAAIVRFLRDAGFRTVSYARSHGELSRVAPRRVIVEPLEEGVKLLPRLARYGRALARDRRNSQIGFVVYAWRGGRHVGGGGPCSAVGARFRPLFSPSDLGEVLPRDFSVT
eukprot:TRINITY_DN75337_c0_g1_i1.p1 TRINITY_DN75337_c0_g1~~TRINITY_DN75337_c0_g1_i1.p1  ORF type:complete len:781 (+),score=104.34 TRINITY_DN75337_c0_g1_i1:56-2344(+)